MNAPAIRLDLLNPRRLVNSFVGYMGMKRSKQLGDDLPVGEERTRARVELACLLDRVLKYYIENDGGKPTTLLPLIHELLDVFREKHIKPNEKRSDQRTLLDFTWELVTRYESTPTEDKHHRREKLARELKRPRWHNGSVRDKTRFVRDYVRIVAEFRERRGLPAWEDGTEGAARRVELCFRKPPRGAQARQERLVMEAFVVLGEGMLGVPKSVSRDGIRSEWVKDLDESGAWWVDLDEVYRDEHGILHFDSVSIEPVVGRARPKTNRSRKS